MDGDVIANAPLDQTDKSIEPVQSVASGQSAPGQNFESSQPDQNLIDRQSEVFDSQDVSNKKYFFDLINAATEEEEWEECEEEKEKYFPLWWRLLLAMIAITLVAAFFYFLEKRRQKQPKKQKDGKNERNESNEINFDQCKITDIDLDPISMAGIDLCHNEKMGTDFDKVIRDFHPEISWKEHQGSEIFSNSTNLDGELIDNRFLHDQSGQHFDQSINESKEIPIIQSMEIPNEKSINQSHDIPIDQSINQKEIDDDVSTEKSESLILDEELVKKLLMENSSPYHSLSEINGKIMYESADQSISLNMDDHNYQSIDHSDQLDGSLNLELCNQSNNVITDKEKSQQDAGKEQKFDYHDHYQINGKNETADNVQTDKPDKNEAADNVQTDKPDFSETVENGIHVEPIITPNQKPIENGFVINDKKTILSQMPLDASDFNDNVDSEAIKSREHPEIIDKAPDESQVSLSEELLSLAEHTTAPEIETIEISDVEIEQDDEESEAAKNADNDNSSSQLITNGSSKSDKKGSAPVILTKVTSTAPGRKRGVRLLKVETMDQQKSSNSSINGSSRNGHGCDILEEDEDEEESARISSVFEVIGARTMDEALMKIETLEAVTRVMRLAGLESSNLIFGIDYTASNKYQGEISFDGESLHKIDSSQLNPYQQVITTVGQTLAPFAKVGCIPAYGFGDIRTSDTSIFPLKSQGYCTSFAEVLEVYNDITPDVILSGPTNFAPLIYQSIEICKEFKCYNILVIVADGQVTNERATRRAIVDACRFPLSIIVVGVGDGPWDMMKVFDENLPKRPWDNFHFVEFYKVTADAKQPDLSFAVQSLVEIPDQYKKIKSLGLLNFNRKC